MSLHSIFWINLTIVLVLTVAIMTSYKIAFGWVFILTIIGQITLVVLVYRQLKSSATQKNENKKETNT